MLDYRDKKIWKKLTANVGKGTLLVGIAVWLCASFADSPAGVTNAVSFSPSGAEDAGSSAETFEDPAEEMTIPLPPSDAAAPEDAEPAVSAYSLTEPVRGVLTSDFGQRWGKNHTGIDIGAQEGTEIVAANGGRIVFSGWADGYGNYIIIDHENGFQTAYGHCSELLVAENERVAQGQKIAYVGSTGNSTGPHLHFEVKWNGVFQNPLEYVLY